MASYAAELVIIVQQVNSFSDHQVQHYSVPTSAKLAEHQQERSVGVYSCTDCRTFGQQPVTRRTGERRILYCKKKLPVQAESCKCSSLQRDKLLVRPFICPLPWVSSWGATTPGGNARPPPFQRDPPVGSWDS